MNNKGSKPGTEIQGWKKQRGGHWYFGQEKQRAWLTMLDGVFHIATEGDGPQIPFLVIRDLLDQMPTYLERMKP